MSYLLAVALSILFVCIIVAIVCYNSLVAKRSRMQEAWSGIDVFLKKRYDLIPALVETVKGYASHEKQTLEELTRWRTEAMKSNMPKEKIQSESNLGQALANVLAVSENYPELKASANFLQLQTQLFDIENGLESARRYYNGTVRDNNIAIESFPSNIFAGIFSFEKGVFYQMNEREKEIPKFSF